MSVHMSKQTVSTVVRFLMVCAAAGKRGRCRHPRCKGSLLCRRHKQLDDGGRTPPEATPANIVLVKRKISLARANRLMNKPKRKKGKEMPIDPKDLMEVAILEQEGQDPEVKFAANLAEAEKLGRDADAYNKEEKKDDGDGKKEGRKDSGTQLINGADGAKKITVIKAVQDMLAGGYDITSVHLEPTNNEHMRMLIVAFTLRLENVPAMCTPERTPNLWKLIEAIFTGVFDVWVWSNPPKANGIILDTINLGWSHEQKTPEDPVVVSNGDLRFTDKPGVYRVDVAKSVA